MANKSIDNPFVLNGYVSDEYFCDRERETSLLLDLIRNGNNVVLTSPRRIGKSDFISHVFNNVKVKERYITVQADIFATSSLEEFVDVVGKAIVNQLRSRGRALAEKFVATLRSVQSQLSFDSFGNPKWSVGLGNITRPDTTLEEIFEYLDGSERQCIVAIDEFQQITHYKESWKVEATLRTLIRRCRNARFIFAGSQRHLMAEIFNSPARPFYGSVAFMSLPKLDEGVYAEFCRRLFARRGKQISEKAVKMAYGMLDGVTAYVQRVVNMLFSMTETGQTCEENAIEPAIDSIIASNSDIYLSLLNMLTPRQREVLVAVAKEGEVRNPQSSEFLMRNNLGSASMVASAMRILLDKEMLTKNLDTVSVYDRFFSLWLSRTR